jgi:hypothetical protein
MAAGHRRVADFSSAGADNRLELDLRDLILNSTGAGASDLSLHGAIADPAPQGSLVLPPGQRNVLSVRLARVRGSGTRANIYSNLTVPGSTSAVDEGNRVTFTGGAIGFAKSNVAILPPPPPAVFERLP